MVVLKKLRSNDFFLVVANVYEVVVCSTNTFNLSIIWLSPNANSIKIGKTIKENTLKY